MAFFKNKSRKTGDRPAQEMTPEALPVHVGIIMDGNGRWAQKRGLPRSAGHRAGARVFRKITKYCEKRGIRYLTVYAFSTENWKRPASEVQALMNLLEEYLVESLSDFQHENIRVRFIGDLSPLSPRLLDLIQQAEAATADKTGMTLNIALNYGGRREIAGAVRKMVQEGMEGRLNPEEIDEQTVGRYLYTADQPDPDLILRPSGEYRLSNFLIWQSAYAELVFMDNILWPDFTEQDMEAALEEFARRHRRFGGI